MNAAVFRAFPLIKPSENGFPALVWQKLWSVLLHHILVLLEVSLESKKLLKVLKIAKIIPVKKLGKSDYSDPNAFCPISSFSASSKTIERVGAEKISYPVKRHRLLSLNQYEVLKQNSGIDALFTVQGQIY